jgi:hypothetical protein
MCPLYVSGLIDNKSIQPMAERLASGDCDQLHHFIAVGVWDAGPLSRQNFWSRPIRASEMTHFPRVLSLKAFGRRPQQSDLDSEFANRPSPHTLRRPQCSPFPCRLGRDKLPMKRLEA